MDLTAWPTADDLAAELTAAKLDSTGLDLAGAIAVAVNQFESAIGYSPFLAAGDASDQTFDPPEPFVPPRYRGCGSGLLGGGRLLDLAGYAVSIASVSVDIGAGPEVWDSTRWRTRGRAPYSEISFTCPIWSIPNGITVNAPWGRCAEEIPAMAWKAVLVAAALSLLPTISSAELRTSAEELAGTVKSKKSGPITLEYQSIDPTKLAGFPLQVQMWPVTFQAAVNEYKLVGFA